MDLKVYCAPWCSDCRVAKAFLLQHGIPYTEVNIDADPAAADEVVRQTGKRAIPQFVLNGQWIQPYRPRFGFLHEEMKRLFGVGGYSPSPS